MIAPNASVYPVDAISIHGAVCALGPEKKQSTSIQVVPSRKPIRVDAHAPSTHIDLSGNLLMPGLINSHDHLHFALHPRLGNPPYRNYIHWGEDIHATLSSVIATYKRVPKDVRLWWGLIRNLLCGVTTVCHHDKLWPLLHRKDLPVSVLQQYGWAHSPALGVDLHQAHAATPPDSAFIVHACEGVDDLVSNELCELHRLGVLDAATVIVHGLAMKEADVRLMNEQRASLVVCPSSNEFLFEKLPDFDLLEEVRKIALASDSPITARGDLLDEIRFAIERLGVVPAQAYRMVTESAAAILRLKDGEGTLCTSGTADLIAIRDTDELPAERLRTLSMHNIELVIARGKVQLTSDSMRQTLPSELTQGMEPLWVDGEVRWLRAPVQWLLQQTEAVLGSNKIQLGNRAIRSPHYSIVTALTASPVHPASSGGRG